jgi:hypothetical protein
MPFTQNLGIFPVIAALGLAYCYLGNGKVELLISAAFCTALSVLLLIVDINLLINRQENNKES